jgi:NADH:ubiquinone oxidoreductase subunit 3 (subunit A)
MAPRGSASKSRQGGDEKLFLAIVIALALVAVTGIGSWFAASALSRQAPPQSLLSDWECRLPEFALTG